MQIKLELKGEFKDLQGAVREIRVHRDGSLFFARSDLMLLLYDLGAMKKLKGFYDSPGFTGAAFGPEGLHLLYATEEKIHFFDLSSWSEKMVVVGELREFRDTDVHVGMGWIADGNEHGKIAVKRMGSDEYDPPEFVLDGHQNYVECVCFHPNGNVLASGSADMTVRFWDMSTRSEITQRKIHDDFVTAIAFNPKGDLMVTGDYGGGMKVWNFSME